MARNKNYPLLRACSALPSAQFQFNCRTKVLGRGQRYRYYSIAKESEQSAAIDGGVRKRERGGEIIISHSSIKSRN